MFILRGGRTGRHIHNYGEPKFTWSDDYSSCTAVFTCADGDDQKAIECTVTSVNNADGSVSYTAVAEFNGESYTMQQTVAAKEEPEEGNPTGSGNNNNSETQQIQTTDLQKARQAKR